MSTAPQHINAIARDLLDAMSQTLFALVNAEPDLERVGQSLPHPFHPPARRVL